MENKILTHNFSMKKSSGSLEITSEKEFTVVIDGKEDESYDGTSVKIENLPLNFGFEIYDGEKIRIIGDGEITAHKVPNDCSRLFLNSRFKYIDMSKVNPKDVKFMFEGSDKLTRFKINLKGITDISGLFYWCSSLASFPKIDTSKITKMDHTWYHCTGLSKFPKIDTSKVESMKSTWFFCKGLTEFPKIDTSKVRILSGTWAHCTGLTSFPAIDTSNVRVMNETWLGCISLISFPKIDIPNIKSMLHTWYDTRSLEKPTFDD